MVAATVIAADAAVDTAANVANVKGYLCLVAYAVVPIPIFFLLLSWLHSFLYFFVNALSIANVCVCEYFSALQSIVIRSDADRVQ